MPSDNQKVTGIIQAAHGNGFFSVVFKIDAEERIIKCQLSGKMRKNNIKVVEGDQVDIELDPMDGKKGRITYRRK